MPRRAPVASGMNTALAARRAAAEGHSGGDVRNRVTVRHCHRGAHGADRRHAPHLPGLLQLRQLPGGQDQHVAGLAIFEPVPDGADGAETALQRHAGLHLEFGLQVTHQPLGRPALSTRSVMPAPPPVSSKAATTWSGDKGMRRTRTPSAAETALAMAAAVGADRTLAGPHGRRRQRARCAPHGGGLGEGQDRVILPTRAGDAARHRAHRLLQHPTRGLDRAALHLVGDPVGIDTIPTSQATVNRRTRITSAASISATTAQ